MDKIDIHVGEGYPIATAILSQAVADYEGDTTREIAQFRQWWPDFAREVDVAGFRFVVTPGGGDRRMNLKVEAPIARLADLQAITERHSDSIGPLLHAFATRERDGSGFAVRSFRVGTVVQGAITRHLPNVAALWGEKFDHERFDAEARGPYFFTRRHHSFKEQPNLLFCRRTEDAVFAKLLDA